MAQNKGFDSGFFRPLQGVSVFIIAYDKRDFRLYPAAGDAVEEPLEPDDLEGYARLTDASPVKIAHGEVLTRR